MVERLTRLLSSNQVCWLLILAGLLPIIATHLAFALNAYSGGVEGCLPYWDGCASVSRAARSGPGLPLFRALMLPSAMLLATGWLLIDRWLRLAGRASAKLCWQTGLGIAGAVFLILYVSYLGEDGGFYRFMRRYGVYGYFGFTAVAQLLLVAQLTAAGALDRAERLIQWLVFGLWIFGLVFAFRSLFISDGVLLDRLENAVEWVFALLLNVVPMAIANAIRYHPIDVQVVQRVGS